MTTPTRPNTDTNSPELTALWITDDGGVATVTLPADDNARLDALQRMVGGYLDVVRLDEHTDMWVNDEGVFAYGPNTVASRVAGAHGYDLQPYHGPVVLTGGVNAHGDTQGLDDDSATLLASIAFYSAAEGPLRVDEVDGHRFRDLTHRRDRYGALRLPLVDRDDLDAQDAP